MEDLIRRIVREEISRAFRAAEQVADNADMPYETGEIESTALTAIGKVAERVARDVLANTHPVLNTGNASTKVVHVVTTARERQCPGCQHPNHAHGRCPYAVSAGACTCSGASTPSTDECSWCGHASHDEHVGLSCDCGCSGASTPNTDNHRCPRCGRIERYGHYPACPSNDMASTPSTGTCPCGHATRDHRARGAEVRCGWCLADCSGSTEPRACSYCLHQHGGVDGYCGIQVGKYACPCPYAGGRS